MKYCYGIDIGGTTVKMGFFSTSGELLQKWEIPTRVENGGESILLDICESANRQLKDLSITPEDVLFMGVGVPAAVRGNGIVDSTTNLGWGYNPYRKAPCFCFEFLLIHGRYVRPYWITKDGTKVQGLPKYVHIEDGYNGYISIPISLRTAELVAAGQLELSYDSEKIEIAKDDAGNMLVENGKMFDEMAFNGEKAGSIRFVGNTSDATDVTADDIYVNVRFKKISESTYKGAGKGVFLTFKVSGEKFCNAKELIQKTVDAWDIKY